MFFSDWLSDNLIEIFGAVTGILYVILEVRQNLWLWPVGIVTSAVYIWVFFAGKLYADMSLQGYYLAISILGWYWWLKKNGRPGAKATKSGKAERVEGEKVRGNVLQVSRINPGTSIVLSLVFIVLFIAMWQILSRLTDSPVPGCDSFITSLSIIATWMLARKIYEHWYLWVVVNTTSAILFFTRDLYPTVILYIIYCAMSFAGLAAWKKSMKKNSSEYVR